MRLKHRLEPYLYIFPAFFFMGLVIIIPIFHVFHDSFFTVKSGENVFVGLNNFRLVFDDEVFWTALTNNLKLFLCVPLMAILSLIVGIILFEKIRGWQFYRAVIFVPYILSTTVIGIIFSYLFQYNGVINTLLRSLGFERAALDWLGNPSIALWTVAGVIIWKQTGFGVVLFLSRFMGIDQTIYEAAEIDGANQLQKHIYITIPQSSLIIEFYIIITLIDMLSWVFNYIYVMTSGGPGNSTTVLEFLIYKKAFGGGNFNIAMAISVILLVLASVLVMAYNSILKRGDSHE